MPRLTSSTVPLAALLLVAAFLSLGSSRRQAAPSGNASPQGRPGSVVPSSGNTGAVVPPAGNAGGVVQRSVTVSFNYDFGKNPSCAQQPKLKNCLKQFVVYDSSASRAQLFTIPVPAGAHGLVKGITGQSPRRAFIPGRHRIAVTAQNAAGVESAITGATFIVDIKPDSPAPAAR